MEKFMIYYEPIIEEKEGNIKSFTYSIEPIENEYKLKIVEEYYNEEGTVSKIKIKEYDKNIKEIIDVINSINFDIKLDTSNSEGLVIIKYGEKKIISNSLTTVSSILNIFNINKFLQMNIKELQTVQNIKETVKI